MTSLTWFDMGGVIAIAGHLGPFRRINDLHQGDETAFLHGDQWAYLAGILAVLLGAVVAVFCFPKMERQRALLAEYRAADTEPAAPTDVPAGPPQPTPA
jgi:hypothetical protein